ncbi:MAG TPA: translocation/assembly module TamB domain-containing protein [Thermoanaerobaculia bacterium]|nr:translocation/assembly module TamB domain-containing protein [Thermoanaerobaculia bacterium]
MNRPRVKKILIRASVALIALVAVLAAAFWFLAGTQSGTQWLFTRLGALMPGKLEVAEMTGPLRGPLDIRGLRYEREGFEMTVKRVQLEWKLRELLQRQLDIQRLYADGIRILTTPSEEETEKGPLPDVNLRFNIIVRDARVTDLSMGAKNAPPGEKPFVIDRIALETTAIRNDVRVDSLIVRSPMFDADVKGSVRPQGDYPVDLDVKWTFRAPDMAPFSGNGQLTGTLKDLQVEQTLGAPFPASLNATLYEPMYNLRFDGRAKFSDFNPRRIKADLPDIPASGQIAIKGNLEDFTSFGTVEGVVEQLGAVRADYSLAKEGEVWRIQSADVALPGTPTRISAKGTVKLDGENMDMDAQASWQNLAWPLRGGEPVAASRKGSATVAGNLEQYRAEVRADVVAGPVPQGTWVFEGTGDRQRFRFESFQGNLLAGRLQGRGEVGWEPVVRWNAVLRGDGINPGQLAAQFPGRLSFAATTRGQLAEAGPVGTVQISRLGGTLREQPVAAVADLRLAGDRYQLSRLDLTWSDAKLAASGWIGDILDLAFDLSAPNLGVAVPQGGGSVVAKGRVSGPMKMPRIQATAEGQGVRVGTTTVSETAVVADVDLSPSGNVVLDVRSTGILSGERRIEELTVRGRGRRSSHEVVLSANNEQGRVDLALAGGLTNPNSFTDWRGQIRRLDLRSEQVGNWSLAQPAALAASTESVGLQGFCWQSGGAQLCANGGWAKAGPWNVDSTVADFPLNRFKPFLPPDLEITGNLNGNVRARGSGAALAMADIDLRPGPGELRFPGDEGRTLTFRYEQGVIRAQAGAGGQGVATAQIALVDVGNMSARVNIPRMAKGVSLQSQPLSGRVDVNLANLAFLEGFVPDVNDPAGSLVGGYDLSGTVGTPRFVGEARLSNGKADIPRLGIELRDLQLAATGNGTGALDIDGSVRSGKGTLRVQGRAGVPGPETPIRLAISGNNVQAMDTEEIKLVVSPDLEVTYDRELFKIAGDVTVPSADIEMEKRGEQGPVAASKDVVFVNAGQEALPDKDMALSARVRIILGKDVNMNVLGLKAKPTGSLLAIEEPGRVTRGVGELELKEGTFKAYGQDLTIERGRIIFAGGPINNPGLDVRAFRRADDGTVAGINAKGTLETPEVTLWSDPPMGQSEQLAYLLMGRPLNRVSPQEGDRLANAATALGLRGGNLLAKKLAARYGLEEARIESDGSLEQASLVVGKYLSPRLYVTYGIGLFEPINTFRIRYLLSDKWTLQAESGEGTSADALYVVERGGPDPKKQQKKKEEEPAAVGAVSGGGG